MKPPKTITAGPYEYVVLVDTAAMNARSVASEIGLRGETDHHTLTITLDAELSPVKLAETLLHEALHTLTTMVGIVDDLGPKEEERFVARLAPVLLDLLRRNPTLVAFLTTS